MSIRNYFGCLSSKLAICPTWFIFAIAAALPLQVAAADLTVSKAGLGFGTVTSTPSGITCGSECYSRYPRNTLITLTATPTPGSGFNGWTGACIGTAMTVSVVLKTKWTTCTANFGLVSLPPQFNLNVSRVGTGTGSVSSVPAGIACGSVCSHSYVQNTTVTLTATAATGAAFSGWSGSCAGTTTSTSVVVNANSICLVTFTTVPAMPGTADLSWDPVISAALSGYRVYYGTSPGTYQQSMGQGLDAGNTTTFAVNGLTRGIRYYFVVTAYDAANGESDYSNEAVKDVL